ncbi:MAG TPA: hypothetical protein VHO25_15520, partial [Polyangiaceae bacterium]|nr:hypothetical protein [Polyangiaceae bacterium]
VGLAFNQSTTAEQVAWRKLGNGEAGAFRLPTGRSDGSTPGVAQVMFNTFVGDSGNIEVLTLNAACGIQDLSITTEIVFEVNAQGQLQVKCSEESSTQRVFIWFMMSGQLAAFPSE